MTLFRQGVAGARGYNPKGIILHNDAGSQAANAAFYRGWLPTHQAENGFAHYYIGSDGTYQAELDCNKAWHCGNSTYNRDYIGIEACQSMGNEATLLANEQASFKLMANLCKKYGIVPNRTTLLLHKEVSATACPHRSWALHGQSVNAVKDYFIAQVVKYMSGEPIPEPVKPKPEHARLDIVNVNSQTFQVVGWLLNLEKDLRKFTYWLIILDAKNNELGRFKGEKITRADVAKAYPNPSGTDVGVQFGGLTPEGITKGNDNYKFVIRASDNIGNINHTEIWFDGLYDDAPDTNCGHLDETQPIDGKLRLAGWHLASNQQVGNKHFLFLMDAKTKKEITRWDVTNSSYFDSPDVKRVYPNKMLVQAEKCRFDQSVEVPEKAKGKRTYIMSRYAADVLGNAIVADTDLNDFLIFL